MAKGATGTTAKSVVVGEVDNDTRRTGSLAVDYQRTSDSHSGRARGSLLEPKWWPASTAGVPHCQNDQRVVERRVVDVVTTARQEDPSRASDWRPSIRMSDVGR